jgi:hypothetical protein
MPMDWDNFDPPDFADLVNGPDIQRYDSPAYVERLERENALLRAQLQPRPRQPSILEAVARLLRRYRASRR